MRRIAFAVVAFVFAASAGAQTRFSVGTSAGTRLLDTSRSELTAGANALLEYRRLGLQLTTETAPSAAGGGMQAVHADLTYRVPIGRTGFALIGAGGSRVRLGDYGPQKTWNAELELGRHFSRSDFYVSVRQYSYSFGFFRNQCEVCASTPVVAVGARLFIEQ